MCQKGADDPQIKWMMILLLRTSAAVVIQSLTSFLVKWDQSLVKCGPNKIFGRIGSRVVKCGMRVG